MLNTPRVSQHNDSMSSTAQAEESLKELILKVGFSKEYSSLHSMNSTNWIKHILTSSRPKSQTLSHSWTSSRLSRKWSTCSSHTLTTLPKISMSSLTTIRKKSRPTKLSITKTLKRRSKYRKNSEENK